MSTETVRPSTNGTYALTESDKVSLVSAKEMTLSETSFNYITQLLKERKQMEASRSCLPTTKNNIWVTYGKMALEKKERSNRDRKIFRIYSGTSLNGHSL